MITTRQIGAITEIASDSGYIHIKGTDVYFKRGAMAKGLTEADYEEVAERPTYTRSEYESKVNDLIREKYNESQELAVLRKRYTNTAEFDEYFAYCEDCKGRAKEMLEQRSEVRVWKEKISKKD